MERREAVLRACSLEVAESPIARVEKPAGKRVSEKGKGDDRERIEAQTHLLNKVDRSVSSPQSAEPPARLRRARPTAAVLRRTLEALLPLLSRLWRERGRRCGLRMAAKVVPRRRRRAELSRRRCCG